MFSLTEDRKIYLYENVQKSFIKNDKPIPLGKNRNGTLSSITLKFLELLDAVSVTNHHNFTPSQLLTIIIKQYNEADVLCYCGSSKTTLSFTRLPVFCSTECYKSCPDGKLKISRIKRELYANEEWKERTESKKIATNRKRFGCDHAMQNPESFEKQQASSYSVKLHKGIKMQGYEPQVYDYITRVFQLDIISGSDFLNKNNERLIWRCNENKKHYTYPDFYSPLLNSFIEVKSDYTRLKNDYKINKTADLRRDKGYGYYVITHRPNLQYFKFCIEHLAVI